jgi:hypothetical protein
MTFHSWTITCPHIHSGGFHRGSHVRTMSFTTTVHPSSSTMAADSRAVRFETECVLIPEPPAESLIRKLGKSFTLPLLKKSPEVEADPRARIIEERFGGRGVGHRWVLESVVPLAVSYREVGSCLFLPYVPGTGGVRLHRLGMIPHWSLV